MKPSTRNLSLALLLVKTMTASAATDLTVERKPLWQNEQTGSGQQTALNFTALDTLKLVGASHQAGRSTEKWLPEVMGGGVAIIDANADGAPDILLVNSGQLGKPRPAAAHDVLLINDGQGNFSNQSAKWGLAGVGYGMGAGVADIDNNGFDDLILTNFEGDNRVLLNNGKRFIDATQGYLADSTGGWATSVGFADFNADGWLDLVIGRYIEYTQQSDIPQYQQGERIYSSPTAYAGLPNSFYLNQNGNKFTPLFVEEGRAVDKVRGKTLALAISDIDRDGDQDVYIANDITANQLWINDGKANFKERAQFYGVAYSRIGREMASMGVDVSDFDADGNQDLVVTNFHGETTTLYKQRAPNDFIEVSDAVGIGLSARQRLSFGIEFFDADNDGDEDLLVANGHINDSVWKNSTSISFAQFNTLYELQDGGYFVDVSAAAGPALQAKQVSRGLAVADFDADGRLDYVIANNNDVPQIAFNRSSSTGSFINLWLEGRSANRSAIGARVEFNLGGKRLEREIMGAQSYLGVSSKRIHLGTADQAAIDLTIYWPDGSSQKFAAVKTNRFYHLLQGGELVPYQPGEFTRNQSQ